jgi:hypothetical protein
MKLRGTQPALEKLGGEAASVCQRVEDNAFHLPRLAKSGIGFSPWRAVAAAEAAEDDAKTNRRMRKIFCALPGKRR